MTAFGKESDFGFGGGGGGGGSCCGCGCDIYSGASPTTCQVGGMPVNTAIFNCTYTAILQCILVPYIAPSFNSFTMNGQSTSVQVGTTLSTPQVFSWGFSNANVCANTMKICDHTNGCLLANNISIVSPSGATGIGTVQKTSATFNRWCGEAINTVGGTLTSPFFTVNWYWLRFAGESVNPTLNEAEIEALSISGLASGFSGSYAFGATSPATYKYFAFPDSFGSPTATTGFKDASTNLAVSMADATDDVFYSNTQNGWSYGLVSVTNSNGIATNYRVYRTKNLLGGTITIILS